MSGPDFTPWPPHLVAHYRARGYWRGQSLDSILEQGAAHYPQRCAVVCGERRWTYQELATRSEQLARALYARGLRAGMRVLLQLPNIGEFFEIFFALQRLGAVPVMGLAAHRKAEAQALLLQSEAVAWFVAAPDSFDFPALAAELLPLLPSLREVWVVGTDKEMQTGSGGRAHLHSYQDLFELAAAVPAAELSLPPSPNAGRLALLQLSGGSTGLPKLIPRTHDDYLYSIRASADICALDANSVYLSALPLGHNFALSSPGSLGTLLAGGCVVLAAHPGPDCVLPLIAREQVTVCALVPPLALLWLQAGVSSRDLPSLKLLQVGGARLDVPSARRLQQAFPGALQQVFGMAEGLVNYTRFDDSAEIVAGTQGRPISEDDEVRIVDDDDVPLADGIEGHLQTRGPYTIRGYFQAEEHNLRAFTSDGFYRTGDLVRRLPSGHLQVTGRAKDQINRGGEKIAAEEVEQHLRSHPQVHDVALVAVPDAWLGERSCACIVSRETGAVPGVAQLRAHLKNSGLAQYKIPDRFTFLPSLPHTAVGKVDKRSLRQMLASQSIPSPQSGVSVA